jgi:cytochrome c peroxidase
MLVSLLVALFACSTEPPPAPAEPTPPPAPAKPDAAAVQARAAGVLGALPANARRGEDPAFEAKVTLGRTLYHDTRLSLAEDLSCASCHDLTRYGVDGQPTSTGHQGQLGGRNSPTVYNAALHLSQFWDGRAADVEAQAKGPVLNPVEMAMPDEASVVKRLAAVPAYKEMFAAAFPGEADALTYDNMANAIGAFERTLITPAPFDKFIAGDLTALSEAQVDGLALFLDTGCQTCHMGPLLGGTMYQKLGLARPYEDADPGRAAITNNDAEKQFFKVPSLRNVEKTGPYFHTGKVADLSSAVRLMASHQLGKDLTPEQVASIESFLTSLTAEIPADMMAKPEIPGAGGKGAAGKAGKAG